MCFIGSSKRYETIPVYTRKEKLLINKDAEAVVIKLKDKEYIVFVSYKSPDLANHFFQVDDVLIHGEVVIIEKSKTKTIVKAIK